MKTYPHVIHIKSYHKSYSIHQITIKSNHMLTSLLKSGQLIIPNKDKQSNSFSIQGPCRPARDT